MQTPGTELRYPGATLSAKVYLLANVTNLNQRLNTLALQVALKYLSSCTNISHNFGLRLSENTI